MSGSQRAALSILEEKLGCEMARDRESKAESAVEPNDEALLLRIQASDMEALSLLFQRYSRMMFGIALRVLQNRDEAEDLVQDVFLFLFFKGRLFDPAKGNARSWIMQVTYHRAFDRRKYLNARSFYDRRDCRPTDGKALPPGSGDNLEEFIAWKSCLRPAFDELSDDQRSALMLHFYEGYTIREISEKMRQPIGNVQHHLYRGLDRLRKHVFYRNGAPRAQWQEQSPTRRSAKDCDG